MAQAVEDLKVKMEALEAQNSLVVTQLLLFSAEITILKNSKTTKPLIENTQMHLVRELVRQVLAEQDPPMKLDEDGIRHFIEISPLVLEEGKEDVTKFLLGEEFDHKRFDVYFSAVATGLNRMYEKMGRDIQFTVDQLRERCFQDLQRAPLPTPEPIPQAFN